MAQIFGDYSESLPASREYLTIVFSPGSISLQQRWGNNGLSADFMADYFATFFPRDPTTIASTQSKAEVKSVVSFIANELLENAMKFCDRTLDYPISITLRLSQDSLIFVATNSLDEATAEHYQVYIQTLLNSDPDDLLLHQLEANAADEHSTGSGLGILTLINDYRAKVGWKFETVELDSTIHTVTIMVYLMM